MGKVQILAVLTMDGCLSSELYYKAHQDLCLDRCNVRELRQKVMGAVLQAQEGVVMKEHLELAVTKPTSTVNFALRNDAEDKERILRALKQANGNRSVAAELLGIGRTTLYSKLEEYGLKYKFKQS